MKSRTSPAPTKTESKKMSSDNSANKKSLPLKPSKDEIQEKEEDIEMIAVIEEEMPQSKKSKIQPNSDTMGSSPSPKKALSKK